MLFFPPLGSRKANSFAAILAKLKMDLRIASCMNSSSSDRAEFERLPWILNDWKPGERLPRGLYSQRVCSKHDFFCNMEPSYLMSTASYACNQSRVLFVDAAVAVELHFNVR